VSELSLSEVWAGYAGTDILRAVSLAVSPGECVGVLGPNGAGKSTLLKVLSGQLKVRSGVRELDGRDVKSWAPYQAARDGVRWVGEPRPVYPGLTVRENLEIGGIRARGNTNRNMAEIYELLPVLHEKRDARAASLSGGQQQQLAIGQALMSKPRFLCLDEPSLGLSPAMVVEVTHLITRLVSDGVGVVWAEQFPEIARAHSTKLVVLSAGVVLASGSVADVQLADIERAYLG
jgi:branched-chain amino acid transport system ATP-binding protein